VLKQEN